MTGKKPTQEQLRRRVHEVRCLLEAGARTYEIKRVVMGQYGVSYRTVADYIARARKQILADSLRPAHVHRAEALAFYRGVLADPEVPAAVKVRTNRYLCKLLGIEGPEKIEIIDVDQHNIAAPDDARHAFDELLATLRDRGGTDGAAVSPGGNGKSNGSAPAA